MQKATLFFSSARGTFSRIDHKPNLSKFKKIEIISKMFSDHNAMRLDINYRGEKAKNTNSWRLKNTLITKRLLKK